MTDHSSIQKLDIPLERDLFIRTLIRELAGVLEEIVGYEDASGYISLVGQKIGLWLNDIYCQALGMPRLTREQVSEVLVDLKHRIQGDFHIIEENEEKIILGCNTCPFEEKVIGRQSMCMMTSNVFGYISAQNLGYAKVQLNETIAANSSHCLVTIFLKPNRESQQAPGREYFGD